MFKRVSLIISSLLLSIILLGYIFRLPLVQWAVTPQLEKAGITLSCLDFSVTAQLNVHADKVCLTYQNQQLELIDITVNTKQVIVEHAVLSINPLPKSNQSSSAAKKLALALPEKRPLIAIKQLVIKSNDFNKPLKINLAEPILNQFNITGDINAKAILANNKLTGQFSVDDSLLKQLINTENTVVAGISFSTQQVFSFDGIELQLNGDVNAQFEYAMEQCRLEALADGRLIIGFNLNSKLVELDSSLLNNKLNLTPTCSSLVPPSDYADFIAEQTPLNWQIKLPKVISITNNHLTLPMLNIISEGDNQFEITLMESELNFTNLWADFKSMLAVSISTPDIKNIELNAEFKNNTLKGNYTVALNSLPDFIASTSSNKISANKVNASGQFNLINIVDGKPSGNATSRLTAAKVDFAQLSVEQYEGRLTAQLDDALNAQITLKTLFKTLKYNEFKLTDISNTITAKANLTHGELFADLSANTVINKFNSPVIKLNNIKVASTGLQSRALKASHHVFVNDIELAVNHHISAVEHPFEIVVPTQSIVLLNTFIHQFEPLAQLTQGTFNGRISGDVNLQHASFAMELNNVSALYNDYLASDLSSQFVGEYNSGQLNVKPTTFNLNELRAGVVIKNIKGNWQVKNNNARMFDIAGALFDGEFSLDKYSLNDLQQVANVKFKNIDASKLITLDEQSGITLSGRFAGTLPVHFNNTGIEVVNGSLSNQGAGKLMITNNAAFDSVMQQQQELQPVLGLLKNLDIQKLNSSVALKSDGWLKLGVNLQGYNKQAEQQVNFNYNHEENIFTLLRALRLSDEITQKVEQQYSQKGN